MAFRAVTPCTRGLIIEKPRREERGGVKILDRVTGENYIVYDPVLFPRILLSGHADFLVVGFGEIKKMFQLYFLYGDINDIFEISF